MHRSRFIFITLLFMFSILPLHLLAIEKPALNLSVEVNFSPANIFDKPIQSAVFDTVLNLKQFEIVLVDALRNLSNEIRLQDLLTNADVILSNQKGSQGRLEIMITFENFQRQEERFEYIVNNLSGEYIKWGNEYIRVYLGERYKVDYSFGKEVYTKDSSGMYVKGYDGKYYMTSTFYSKVPHTDVSYSVKLKVEYYLYINDELRENGSFDVKNKLSVISHEYDPYNGRLLRYEYSLSELANTLAKSISRGLISKLQYSSSISGIVESIKFPRVLIDVGERDGVKSGNTFGVKDNEKLIAEIKVIRTGYDYSECEVTYIRKDTQIRIGNEVFLKTPDLIIPVGLKLQYTTDTSFSSSNSSVGFGILFKHFNIFREVTSILEFAYTLSLEKLIAGNYYDGNLEANVYFRLFGFDNSGAYFLAGLSTVPSVKSKIGMLFKLGIFEMELFIPFNDLIVNPSLEGIRIGGGISW